jgi:hypothetical protein
MTTIPNPGDETARLESDGTLILSEAVMARYVHETLGCTLMWEELNRRLGLKLLRDRDDPPYRIERRPVGNGVQGVLVLKDFLAKKNYAPGPAARDCPCRYYPRFHMLEVVLDPEGPASARRTQGVLDDYPAL